MTMWIVELAQIFSCFDVNMVILEKCGILYGDDKEVIKSKIGQYFEESLQNSQLI